MSADHQQERPGEGLCQYVVGFVEGEGSFHVAVQRNGSTRLGLQVIPEFHVSQNRERAGVLTLVQQVLGCGYIKTNHPGNLRDRSVVLVVRNRQDLVERVVPFFEQFPLRSSKQREFQTFATILRAMERGEHLTKHGMTQILHQAFAMNGGRYRKRHIQDHLNVLESSETVRQASRKVRVAKQRVRGKDTVRPAWRHAEAGRNDQPFRWDERRKVTMRRSLSHVGGGTLRRVTRSTRGPG